MTSPTVFVVDDDRSVRIAVERLLRADGLAVETFASAAEFLKRQPAEHPGCVLLDVRMPELTGLELQQVMADANIDLPVVFFTGHGDVPTSVEAMKAGAEDFLLKPFEDRELLRVIHRAIERDRGRGEVRTELAELERRMASLTPREKEVLRLVVRGMRNKQIAEQLERSEKTVKIHRGRAMHKMEADSLAELVRMAVKLGIARD